MLKEKLVDFVHPLLKQLAEAKSRATTCDHSLTTELFEKMERAIRFMEDVSLRLERWEKEVQDSVGDITKHLNDIFEDDGNLNRAEGFQLKLETVDQKVSDLKAHMTPPLVLPHPHVEEESSSPTLPPHLMTPSLSDVAPNFEVVQRYENLTPVLQKCLLSLCIFPKDAVIKKRLLIYWWIGEGLATPTSRRTAQEVGEGLFQALIKESFITPIYRDHNSVEDSCRVPPLIRDELVRLAVTNQGFRLHTFGEPIESLAAPSSVCLLVDAPERERERAPELGPLKTTTCFNFNRHCLKFGRGEFSLMKNVEVLQLGRWQSSARHHVEVDNTEFLESSLGSFKKLRYLSLQGISRIKALPPSIGKLTNLTILNLRDCNNLERLPVEITMLSRLTHLDVSECYLLDHMPKGLDSLSKLQVLKGFVVASSTSRNPPCRLGGLSKLKKLDKLSIRIIGRDSFSLVADGELSELSKFEALRSLTISWEANKLSSSSSSSHQGEGGLRYLDHVSLPRRLEKLDLRCFPGSTVPTWLIPNPLKKLYIRGGRLCGFWNHSLESRCRGLDVLRLPALNVLRLRLLSELDMQESELLEIFPFLCFLEIHECKKMSSTARRINRSPEMLNPPHSPEMFIPPRSPGMLFCPPPSPDICSPPHPNRGGVRRAKCSMPYTRTSQPSGTDSTGARR